MLFHGRLPQAPGTPVSFVVRRINFSLACRSPKVLFPLTVSQLFYLLLFPAFCFPLSARAKAVPPSVPAVSVRMVHPDSQKLDRERSPVPEGYTPYTYEFRDRHGKMQRERLFLKNTPIITESEVEQARIEPERRECLHITLNTQGGKTMKAATSAMNLGRDRLALVVQGKIKSAPVVQAVISRTFEISGLDGKMKPPDWRNCSTGRHPQKKTHPSFHRIWPCTPSIRKAAVWWKKESSAYRASGSGSSRRTGRKKRERKNICSWGILPSFRRLRQTCGARYGTSGKPGHHLERRSIP